VASSKKGFFATIRCPSCLERHCHPNETAAALSVIFGRRERSWSTK
jgi:hypothetical protein